MENFALASFKSPIPVGSSNPRTRGGAGGRRGSRCLVSSELRSGILSGKSAVGKLEAQSFASISSTTVNGTPQIQMTCPPSYIGSPMLWIGVGVGLSALFSVVATKLKRQAILQAFKAVMGQEAPQSGQFSNSAFSPGSPFPFPAASPSIPPASSQAPVASQPVISQDDPTIKVESIQPSDAKDKTEPSKEVEIHGPEILKMNQTQDASEPAVLVDNPAKKVDKIELSKEANSQDT